MWEYMSLLIGAVKLIRPLSSSRGDINLGCFLSNGRKPEVYISHARAVVSPRFAN